MPYALPPSCPHAPCIAHRATHTIQHPTIHVMCIMPCHQATPIWHQSCASYPARALYLPLCLPSVSLPGKHPEICAHGCKPDLKLGKYGRDDETPREALIREALEYQAL